MSESKTYAIFETNPLLNSLEKYKFFLVKSIKID